MPVSVRKIGTMLVAEVVGDLDMVTGAQLKEAADQMWEHYETLSVFVLDLSKVGFNDSSGLGAILGRYKKVNARSGTMIIVGAKAALGRTWRSQESPNSACLKRASKRWLQRRSSLPCLLIIAREDGTV